MSTNLNEQLMKELNSKLKERNTLNDANPVSFKIPVPETSNATFNAETTPAFNTEATTAAPLTVYKVVLDNLNKKITVKEGAGVVSKTVAQAMIDGTITPEEIAKLNLNNAIGFPPKSQYAQKNNKTNSKLPEEHYTSIEAMENFVETIGPYLSDEILYKVTDVLTKCEMINGDGVFRNASLAKAFINYENKRHNCNNLSNAATLPVTFISHMSNHLVGHTQEVYSKENESTNKITYTNKDNAKSWKDSFEEVLRFNFKINKETHYAAIIDFNAKIFNSAQLKGQPIKDPSQFNQDFQTMKKRHEVMEQDSASKKLASDDKKSSHKLNSKKSGKFLAQSAEDFNAFYHSKFPLDKANVKNIILTLKYYRNDKDFIAEVKENILSKAAKNTELAKFILTSKKYSHYLTTDEKLDLLIAHANDKIFLKEVFPRFNILGRVNLEQLAKTDVDAFKKIISTPALLLKLGHKNTLEIAHSYNSDAALINSMDMLYTAIKKDADQTESINFLKKDIFAKLDAAWSAKTNHAQTDVTATSVNINNLNLDTQSAGDTMIANNAPDLKMLIPG